MRAGRRTAVRSWSHDATAPRSDCWPGCPSPSGARGIAGATTAILEGGDGPPLVLLHGGIECGGAVWAPVVTRARRALTASIIPDVPGPR